MSHTQSCNQALPIKMDKSPNFLSSHLNYLHPTPPKCHYPTYLAMPVVLPPTDQNSRLMLQKHCICHTLKQRRTSHRHFKHKSQKFVNESAPAGARCGLLRQPCNPLRSPQHPGVHLLHLGCLPGRGGHGPPPHSSSQIRPPPDPLPSLQWSSYRGTGDSATSAKAPYRSRNPRLRLAAFRSEAMEEEAAACWREGGFGYDYPAKHTPHENFPVSLRSPPHMPTPTRPANGVAG